VSAISGAAPGAVLKRLLVLFWAMYFSMIALTNLVDLLDELGAGDWTFLDSGNFAYLSSVVKVYGLGPGLTKALLAGAWAVETVGAILFWRALLGSGSAGRRLRTSLQALCWGAAVWTAFVFMVEFFVAYEAESVFRELLMLTIVSALAIALIPDDAGGRSDTPA
jgi:hypothetical protein